MTLVIPILALDYSKSPPEGKIVILDYNARKCSAFAQSQCGYINVDYLNISATPDTRKCYQVNIIVTCQIGNAPTVERYSQNLSTSSDIESEKHHAFQYWKR